jgi:hypothetical protein
LYLATFEAPFQFIVPPTPVATHRQLCGMTSDEKPDMKNCFLTYHTKLYIFFFFFFFFFFLVESFGLLKELFPFPPILDAGSTVFDLHLANVLFDVILPSVLGSSL